MGVAVTFDDDNATVDAVPGTQASCSIRVENTGMVVDSMLLDLLGEAAEWATVEPAQMNLLPGASAQAQVVFNPPRLATLEPGDVPFGLRAMSMEDPDGSRIEEGVVRVGEFSDLGVDLVPKSATGRRSANYRLVVENRGNRPEDLTVEAVDPDVKLGFHTRPQVFTAAPGTATFVRLTAVPRKTFFKGPSKTLPFQVSALPDEGEAAKADGIMLEKQTLPEWLLPLLGIAVLLGGLLFALWFTVLRPVVHNSATAASAAQNAADSAKSAAKSANSAAKSASSAASSKSKPPAALDVTLPSPTLLSSTTELASVTGSFAKGTGTLPSVIWTSSAPKVAAVSPTGVVKGLSAGSATITATTVTSKHATTTSASLLTPRHGSTISLTAAVSAPPPVLSGSATLNVVAKVKVSTTALPEAPVGKAYTASLNATGGTGAFTWSMSAGSLPAGLSLAPSTGMISGTPTKLGTSSFTVHVADGGPPTQFATKVLTVKVVNALAVNTSSLPGGIVGTAYSQSLSAVGGTSPYTWSIVPGSGSLPAGLSLSPASGLISGTPTTSGSANFVVQVSDASSPSQSLTQPFSINVVSPLTLAAATLPGGVQGSSYSEGLTATGGTQPYSWSVTAGSLPAGVTLNSNSGTISGSPTATGSFNFTVQVADGSTPAQTQAESLTLTVVSPLVVNTSSLPGSTVGASYSQTLAAVGGTAPYAWSIVPGSGFPPAGLSLNPSTGAITGSPASAGSSTFTVQVTDASSPSQSATKSLTINVVSPLTLAAITLPGGVAGTAYSQTLTATGGTQPYTWSVTSGSQPDGITLNPASGTLSGTPTTAGQTSTFTVKVTDASQPALSVSRTFTIAVVKNLAGTVSSLPEGAVGKSYNAPLSATGGTAPYTWTLEGTLPAGLSLIGDTITGTPTATGTFPFTVQVVDRSSPPLSVTVQLSITVVSPLKITSTSLPDGSAGNAYTTTLAATGGTAPYTWSVAGNLPAGLSLNTSTGVISGTALQTGGFPFTVTVTDSATPTPMVTSFDASIDIVQPLNFTEPALPTAEQGLSYPALASDVTTPQNVTGGSGRNTWFVTNGSLPTGLGIDSSTGQVSGKVSGSAATGTYSFTVEVVDNDDSMVSASQPASINVVTALTVAVPALSTTVDNVSYSTDLGNDVSGGLQPYTYSVTGLSTQSNLSAMSFDATSAVLSGPADAPCPPSSQTAEVLSSTTTIPADSTTTQLQVSCQPSTYALTLTVTDAAGYTVTEPISLNINIPLLTFTYETFAGTDSGGQIVDDSGYNLPVFESLTGGYPGGTYTYSTSEVSDSNDQGAGNNNGLPCDLPFIVSGCSIGSLSGINSSGIVTGTLASLPLPDAGGTPTWCFDATLSDSDPLSSNTITGTLGSTTNNDSANLWVSISGGICIASAASGSSS